MLVDKNTLMKLCFLPFSYWLLTTNPRSPAPGPTPPKLPDALCTANVTAQAGL